MKIERPDIRRAEEKRMHQLEGLRKHMELEVSAFVVRSDGLVCDLPVTEELLRVLHHLRQETAKEDRGLHGEGALIGELVQVLKGSIHTPHSLPYPRIQCDFQL